MTFYIPTKDEIQSLQIGDLAPDCFGNMSPITEIYGRDKDVNGKWFICYYVKFHENGSISHSLKEGELDRTVELTKDYTSHELDDIEKELSISQTIK